jgi:hypothetical protein
MRLVVLVLGIALLAAGCGSEGGGGSGGEAPAASSESSASGEGTATSGSKLGSEPDPDSGAKPPPIVLVSDGGRQVGVTGSFCVDDPVKGVGTCADGPAPAAKELTVVHPGDRIAFRVEGARAIRNQDCHARDLSCIGEAQVTRPGCPETPLARVFLERGHETAWQVALEPGDYELQLFLYFGGGDGRSGDVSAAFGLRVDPEAERAIVPAKPDRVSCR